MFLSMGYEIDNSGDALHVKMVKYSRALLAPLEVSGVSRTPAKLNLLSPDDAPVPLDEEQRKLFHRVVAQLNYLAKKLRFDMLLPINVL